MPGPEGIELGAGHTGEPFALSNGGSAWFGLAQDPFWGDAVALFAFNRGLAENQYRPELFSGTPGNLRLRTCWGCASTPRSHRPADAAASN